MLIMGRVGLDCSVSKKGVTVFVRVGVVVSVGDKDKDRSSKNHVHG